MEKTDELFRERNWCKTENKQCKHEKNETENENHNSRLVLMLEREKWMKMARTVH